MMRGHVSILNERHKDVYATFPFPVPQKHYLKGY